MASFFEERERKVIPNFRNVSKAIELGELNSSINKQNTFVKQDIEGYKYEFKKNKNTAFAGDLISAALVNNNTSDRTVLEAAEFILTNENESTFSQKKLARKILGNNDISSTSKIKKIEEFIQSNTLSIIRTRIASLKNLNSFGLPNPIVYTELARLYSIIGQSVKAYQNIQIAKNLAPNNRYVLRSFARLMAHFGDIEQAHDALKKAERTKYDPWLIASEISLASLRGRKSTNVKRGIEMISSKKYDPLSLTELSASIATLELVNGNRKSSKGFFLNALDKPNDNSIAQVEWAVNKDHLFEFDIKKYNVANNYEGLALDSFYNKNWGDSIQQAESWFIDTPFTTRPVILGHHIAQEYLEDHETAINFMLAGLIANPKDPILINNIAYSYALSNQPNLAFEYIDKVNPSDITNINQKICLTATKGLAQFRAGNFDEGRALYLQAISDAKENKLQYYNWLAIANYAREEVRINSQYAAEAKEVVLNLPNTYAEIQLLKEKIKAIQ